MSPEIVAGLVFLVIYALIVTEKIHRTLAALLGASLMILLKVVDPPNIIIGSQMGKDFNDFLVNLAPAAAVALAVYLVLARWLFRAELRAATTVLDAADLRRLVDEERRIADPRLMRISAVVLGFTILGFLLSRLFGLEGATIALTGAVVLMIVAREDVHEILKTVEWPTLFFFVGLFIVVGGVVKTGIISDLAHAVLAFTGGRTDVAALVVLWMSGLISAIVDNIPYTITMVPLVQELGHTVNIEPLVWALSLGANLGGNATIVGASANVVVASMSESRGYPITFASYLRYGLPANPPTMVVPTIDIWLRYLAFG